MIRPIAVPLAVVLLSASPPAAQMAFQPLATYTSPSESDCLEMADFIRDGIPDLVIAPGRNFVSVFPGKIDGTFGSAITTTGNDVQARAAAVGDVNHDGKFDLVTAAANAAGGYMLVYLGQGDGTFAAPVKYPATQTPPGAVALADFNGDGWLDAALSHILDTVVLLYRGGPGGVFGTPFSVAVGRNSNGLTTGDINRDGKMDLVVSHDSAAAVLLGNGDGTLQGPVYYRTPWVAKSTAIADFNRDGKPDLAIGGDMSGSVIVLFGRDDGSLGNSITLDTPMSTWKVRTADMNQDGKQDIVSSSNGNALMILHGRGDGTFDASQSFTTVPNTTGMVIGDFNHDLRPDVASVANGQPIIGVLIAVLPPSGTAGSGRGGRF